MMENNRKENKMETEKIIEAQQLATQIAQLQEQQAKLAQQERELARQEREQKDRAEAERRKAIRVGVILDVARTLENKLAAAGVTSTVEENDMYPGVHVRVEPNVHVELGVEQPRYSDKITGVFVKVGWYGERPQTYKQTNTSELPYDKIVKSIQRRIAAKVTEQAAWQAKREKMTQEDAVRESNRAEAYRLSNLAGTLYFQPSSQTAGSVRLQFDRTLTVAQAEKLIELLKGVES